MDPSTEVVVVVDDSKEAEGNGNFRTPGFDSHIANKMAVISDWAVRESEPFLVTDVDIVYFQPLQPLLLECLGDCDIALAAGRLKDPQEYNIGQMVIRPSARTYQFFQEVEAALRKPGSRDRFRQDEPANQRILNEMLKASGLKHRFLPPSFANTPMFNQMGYRQRRSLASYHATLNAPPVRGRSCLETKFDLLDKVATLVNAWDCTASSRSFLDLAPLMEAPQAAKTLIVGAGDGRVAEGILRDLSTSPEAEIHAIGNYGSDDVNSIHHPAARDRFLALVEEKGWNSRAHFYEGEFCEALAWMIQADGFWESFDLVYLEAWNDCAELLTSACQSWSLLRPGGLLVWVANEASARVLDSFMNSFSDRAQVVDEGGHFVLRKGLRPVAD
ncbi:putative nucleotide-diphospho-sugar transferase [Haloferula sp. BvORR071]|uniref:putative nucleotide-diphospho-sugar transferase n=1 Tax=Haloferula sp. BvORR071 TaxID=1396141 RepID=UPI002240F1E9|nr:putative nucleotide-diphospho-sugar transferase [Haloferula sp. BvORR071]